AVRLADEEAHVRRLRKGNQRHDLRACTHDALLLFLEPHHEPGLIAEVHDWQVEGVAELVEARRLFACGLVHRSAKEPRVVDHHPPTTPPPPPQTGALTDM